jgi:hypothetical protein
MPDAAAAAEAMTLQTCNGWIKNGTDGFFDLFRTRGHINRIAVLNAPVLFKSFSMVLNEVTYSVHANLQHYGCQRPRWQEASTP